MKSKVVKISVLIICNGWKGCFNPNFNTSDSSVVHNFDDKLCTVSAVVNGKNRLIVRFLSFFSCVFIVVLVILSTFFLATLSKIKLSLNDNTLPISRSWFDKSLLSDPSSLFLLLTALRNNLSLMKCKSYELTLGKLIVRNWGATLN